MSVVYLGANVDVLTDVLHVNLGMMVDRQFNPQKKPLHIYVTLTLISSSGSCVTNTATML